MSKAWMVLSLLMATFVLWQISRIGRRPRGYPPGPPTLPIIGNLHQMPPHRIHLQFQKWADEYGPVYSLILGTKVMIVLSSDQAVRDLLDRRSTIYSSRPEFYMGQQIMSGGLRVLMMANNETWRKIRKLAHSLLNITVARKYVPYQDLESKALLMGLLEDPGDFFNHIRRYSTSLTLQMAFGSRTPTRNDQNLLEMFQIFEKFSEISLSPPCACIDLLRLQDKEDFSDDLTCYTSGSFLQAGSETTANVLMGFTQAMVVFPEVARQAQAEIDQVCGNRLPDLNDVPDLPYIRSCIKESLRWMPVAPLAVPHAVTRDDYYQGYLIPQGAEVVLNVWAISQDPRRHLDPRYFNPGRWAGNNENSMDSAASADITKRDHFIFGAGRRICQGMHIADRSLFLAMSRTLWAFDFKRVVDPEAKQELVPDTDDLVDGMFIRPNSFKADIVPRNEARASQVREEWAKATELLDENMQWKTVPEGSIWKDYEAVENTG